MGVELSRLIILHPSQWDLKWLVPRNAGDESCLKCSFIATLNINPPVLDFLLESPGTKGTCIVCSSSYRAADGRPLFWRVPSLGCEMLIIHHACETPAVVGSTCGVRRADLLHISYKRPGTKTTHVSTKRNGVGSTYSRCVPLLARYLLKPTTLRIN